jgi:hypothetical protein
MRYARRFTRVTAALVFLLYAVPSMAKEPPAVTPWKEIDQLISELKLQEASARLDELLPELRKAGDDSWMRALVRGTQLRAASAEPEEAVRFIRSQTWPGGRRERAVLSLFYAEALKNYYDNYRWEIWKREAVQSKDPAELEKWTAGQVFEAASQAYLDAWKDREALGGVPVAGLADFLEPNNYPKEVRGTLRDTLSYLWVDLLTDTGYWSPRQTNATDHFDLVALFRGGEAVLEPSDQLEQLADPTVHPLLRALTVLADLERWHAAQGNLDGALEARLERVRQLRNHALAPELAALGKELEAVLPEYRKVPWWSMGMSEAADLQRSRGDLVEAVATARKGAAAYPGSPGAQACLAIVQDVEAPEYRMSVTATDGLARRSIQVFHKNLPALWFRAYPLDLDKRLREEGPVFPSRAADLLESAKPAFTWKSELPATPDYQEHSTFLTPPIDRPGSYLLIASVRRDFGNEDNAITSAPFILGGMVVLVRNPHDGKGLEVITLDGEHGEPLAGVTVSLYKVASWEQREGRVAGTTDGQGRLRVQFEDSQGYALAARKGDAAGFILNYFQEEPEEDAEKVRSLVFTDRSIYRPNQKVLWKVLAYEDRGEGRLQAADTSLTVSLVDSNNQAVDSRTVSTNGFGTASGEFVIPPGRPLGNWRVETSRRGSSSIRVEEYKRPTFEVTMNDPAEPLRLGRPATFTGEGRYYFGLPVTHGEVAWRVVRESLYWWTFYDSPSDEETVATGTATPDADGRFTIAFTPDPGDPKGRDVKHLTYRYKVTADLTDEGGETRTAERSFRLGWVSIEAEIAPESALLTAGKPGKVTVHRRDLDGLGRAGDGKWTLYALRQPAETLPPADLPTPEKEGAGFQTEGDRLRSRGQPGYDAAATLKLWEDGPQIASGTLSHGQDGEAELTLPGLDAGAWRLRYETADGSGETFWTAAELIVGASEMSLALPGILQVDDSEAHPGGRVRVLAHSGFADQLVSLETWRGGRLVKETPLRMGRDSNLIDIPIGKEDRGGFSLKLVAVRDFQLVELTANVWIPWDDRRLEIETATFRDRIRPGARETWTLKVRPADTSETAETVAAELLASMYDRSLDLFAPHHPPDPLGLYPNLMGAPLVLSSLGERFAGWIGGSGLQRNSPGADLKKDELRFAFAFEKAMAQPMSIAGGVAGGVAGGMIASAAPPPPPTPELAMDRLEVGAPAQSPAVELRSDFSETAFWEPHLLTGPDGTASIEFTAPDSVTSWTFWVQAITRDLRSGSLEKEVRTVKDLMVRPYLPRFLREGDRADLQVVVNNASDGPLSGEVVLEILEPGTDQSRLADFGLQPDDLGRARARFTAEAGGGATVHFPLATPKGVGAVAFKVTAVAGKTSDGELRSLPVLPSRMHLAQSRFVALQGGGTREMRFDDMTKPDSTRIDEQLAVTLDAQLFEGVLAALPYLVDYPYECTEQTLNRFLSTGIVTRLFDKYPAVAEMAKDLSKRETAYETWDAADPNRKMALEETPWLETSQGNQGGKTDNPLINVLDARVAGAQRDEALMKLQQSQLSEGGFPWWPGGPPSPYMTLYLLYGFAKATESGIDVPRDMVENAWSYIADYYRTEEKPRLADRKCCRELLVFLNYVASAYPDPSWMGEDGLTPEERKEILDDSFAHWRELSGYLKVLLALTLKRMDRPADAVLVFGAVLDLAKTTEDEGTFWAPEEHGWLWYNDDVETHAFALLALMEIAPQDPRRHGLVQWLFLNKQLSHWKSTRATAEVLYALVHYLEAEGTLAVREEATVRVGGQTTAFVFEPGRFTGKHNQVVVPGEKMDPATTSRVVVENRGPNLMFASATWQFSTEELPKESRGDLFGVTRRYFLRAGTGEAFVLKPLAEGTVLKPGDEVEVQLTITSRMAAEYVHLRDPRPAGLEPGAALSGYKWDLFAPGRYEEVRDSGTNFFFDWLPAGEYTLSYRVRASMAGTFRTGPATIQSMYAPEFTAYSAGDVVTVAPAVP